MISACAGEITIGVAMMGWLGEDREGRASDVGAYKGRLAQLEGEETIIGLS